MKMSSALLASLALLATLAAAALAAPERSEAAGEWTRLLEYDVTKLVAARDAGEGAPGADVHATTVTDEVQLVAIVIGLDRPALGVFVGVHAPSEYLNHFLGDLRMEFTLDDGSTRSAGAAAGGGPGILFSSPDDVPKERIRRAAVFARSTAEWMD